jgi:hypothetical protein
MPERNKIDCEKPADRDTLVQILARNGYTVRIGKEKRTPKANYTYFVEYWKE